MDAWKKLSRIREKYTKRAFVRPDIKVEAFAHERNVKLTLGTPYNMIKHAGRNSRDFPTFTTGPRNVVTMRELARALNDACDFVEESNPKWASHAPPIEIFWPNDLLASPNEGSKKKKKK